MEKINFYIYNDAYRQILNQWHKNEQDKGETALDEFVVPKGELLGDYISFVCDNMNQTICTVATIQDEIVGFLCYEINGTNAHIEIMGVSPQHRGKGIGGNMLKCFKEEMLLHNISKITLDVNKENIVGQNAFSKVASVSKNQTKDNYISYELQ